VTILLNPPPQIASRAGEGTAALSIELLLTAAPGGRDWRDEALCAQTDYDAFFPAKGASLKGAKRVCGRCPVRAACLDYALTNDERFGIWGGLSPSQRRALAHRMKTPAAASTGTEE
jgi:WhiB family redox-sensing transcriptional regulator